jgi:hypothetical protein
MEKDKMKTKLPSRESETRAKQERRKPWAPPSQLDAPPAPDGFVHRWIRAESVGQMDQKNVSARLREGWEFVRGDEYPDTEWPQIDSGKYQAAVANDPLKDQHPSMPISQERSSRVTFGGKNKN